MNMRERWFSPGLLLALALAQALGPVDGARILALFQLNAKSHFVMFEALLKALAARGHQVDVVSHFPQKTPLANYRDLSVEGSLRPLVGSFSADLALHVSHPINALKFFWVQNLDMCEEVFKHPVLQRLLASQERYDAVLTEVFGVDCMLPFGHKFKAPVVQLVSSVLLPWANARFGNPDNPSYIPVYFLPLNPPLPFFSRLANTLALALLQAGNYLVGERATEEQARRMFGEGMPPLAAMQRNASLLLVNSHFSLHQPRPMVPAVVEVAGLHIPPLQPLPKRLQHYLDGATEGAVYFALGSLVRSESLAPDKLRAFLDVFRELPQRVLWKCNCTDVADVPPNVLTDAWLPQNDVLNHPNVHVFITHGGLMGTQEAVQAGVPMVALPFFGDQHLNAQNYVQRGVARVLDVTAFTTQQLREALHAVLHEPGYREKAKELSVLFRDRPQTPLETAVFWTEYVIRHRGAPHMRSAAVDLPWYQYLLLDVFAVIAFVLVMLLSALWLAARALAEWRSALQDASRPPSAASLRNKAKVS